MKVSLTTILNRHGYNISIDQILKDEAYIGLLGQKDEFEVFHTISFLRLHAILHDVFWEGIYKIWVWNTVKN